MADGTRLEAGEAAFQGDGLVTRHLDFTGERCNAVFPFFVDWVSMTQQHVQELPIVSAGLTWAADEDGVVQWRCVRAKPHKGSFDTSVNIRCDGHQVWFSGNVSRFGRPDNLFGFSFAECLERINAILADLDLPPFTVGRRMVRVVKEEGGLPFEPFEFDGNVVAMPRREFGMRTVWTGARIQRLDLTANYATGSLSNARAYMEWLSSQQHSGRVKVGTEGDGETVDWGRGSRRIYAKCYLKSAEVRKHKGPEDVIAFCESVGLVRFEVTLKSTQLIASGCEYLGDIDMAKLYEIFKGRQSVMTRATADVDGLESLPNHFRRTARDYLAGDDVSARLSSVSFWRHRKAILPFGIDIAVKRNVVNFVPKTRVVEVRQISALDFEEFRARKLG